jgi:hypothetical protein
MTDWRRLEIAEGMVVAVVAGWETWMSVQFRWMRKSRPDSAWLADRLELPQMVDDSDS